MSANLADQRSARPELDRQLEGISWALFLIMIGGIGLVQNVPQGAWLIGTGLIMLALNFVRYVNRIPIKHFPLVLGLLALLLGIGGMTGVDIPFFPVLLIIVGTDILFKTVTHSEQSGQREDTVESARVP